MNRKIISSFERNVNLNVQKTFGLHLTIDGYGCDKKRLEDIGHIFNLLDKLPEIIGMTKITVPYVIPYYGKKPEDWGISGFVMIAESHISVHTFPEKNYVTIDVYSCNQFDSEKAVDFFVNAFDIKEIEKNEITRGLKFPKFA